MISSTVKMLDRGAIKRLEINKVTKSEHSVLFTLLLFLATPLYNQVVNFLIPNLPTIYEGYLNRKIYGGHPQYDRYEENLKLFEEFVDRGINWVGKDKERAMKVDIDGRTITFSTFPDNVLVTLDDIKRLK